MLYTRMRISICKWSGVFFRKTMHPKKQVADILTPRRRQNALVCGGVNPNATRLPQPVHLLTEVLPPMRIRNPASQSIPKEERQLSQMLMMDVKAPSVITERCLSTWS